MSRNLACFAFVVSVVEEIFLARVLVRFGGAYKSII